MKHPGRLVLTSVALALLLSSCNPTLSIASPTSTFLTSQLTSAPSPSPLETAAPDAAPQAPPIAIATITPPSVPPTPLAIGSTRQSPVTGMVQVYVPEGAFRMGSTEQEIQVAALLFSTAHDGPTDQFAREETPTHEVYLSAFWIDKTEVTNAMFARCVAVGVCSPPSNEAYLSQSDYWDVAKAALPVITSWEQASVFCSWATGRLPTEAEWEKAARGTYGWQFPWGDAGPTCDVAVHMACGGSLRPVGGRPLGASPYGALDMAGNAAEWVSSLFMPYPYDAQDGREDPSAEGWRVVRIWEHDLAKRSEACIRRIQAALETWR